MPAKLSKTGTDSNLNLVTLSKIFTDENAAREFLEQKRWNGKPFCPRCNCSTVYKLTAKPDSKRPVRPGVYKCKDCRKQFTVRIGTIFEESRLPISKWLMAIHLMTASKKGVSSHQIARQLDVTQKTAWFLCHRIREAMKLDPMAGMLKGNVEVDETYVGGKPRKHNKRSLKTESAKRGRGTDKTPVLVLVERDGRAFSKPLEQVDGNTLKREIITRVEDNSTIYTDEYRSYRGLNKFFTNRHQVVNHGRGEYARFDKRTNELVTTNSAECYFSLLKRSHHGIHHQWSKKHLHRYCNERSFMWNTRKVSDGVRMVEAINGIEGKRLYYRDPVKSKKS